MPGFVSNLELQWELPPIARFLDSHRRPAPASSSSTSAAPASPTATATASPTSPSRSPTSRRCSTPPASSATTVFAISEGGPLAATFAAKHPERVEQLILYASLRPQPVRQPRLRRRPRRARRGALGHRPGLRPAGAVVERRRHPPLPGALRAPLGHAAVGDAAHPSSRLPSTRPRSSSRVSAPTVVLHRSDDTIIEASAWPRARRCAAGRAATSSSPAPTTSSTPATPTRSPTTSSPPSATTASPAPTRVFAALAFVDIVGSTELADSIGDRAFRDLLDRFHGVAEQGLRRRGGRRVNEPGRRAARRVPVGLGGHPVGVRDALRRRPPRPRRCAPASTPPRSNGGVTTSPGSASTSRRGPAPSPAPGELLVTRTVADLVDGSGTELVDRGSHELRGVGQPWQLFSVPSCARAVVGGLSAMTPEQLALVRRNRRRVEQAGDDFARRFYGHLVELHPSAIACSPTTPRRSAPQLVDGVVFFATAVDHPEFDERAHELGELLQAYGVRAADYEVFGHALVAAVGDVVGAGWTPGARRAPGGGSTRLIAETMLEGRRQPPVHEAELSRGVAPAPIEPAPTRARARPSAASAAVVVAGRDRRRRRGRGSPRRRGAANPTASKAAAAAASRPVSAVTTPTAWSARAAARVPCSDCDSSTRRSTTRAAPPNRTTSWRSIASSAKAPRARALRGAALEHVAGRLRAVAVGGQPAEPAVAIAAEQPDVLRPQVGARGRGRGSRPRRRHRGGEPCRRATAASARPRSRRSARDSSA